ncbi:MULTISPECIES: hypothetical protein [unclassified Streptomyces]|uniref:hypothetical protein n=1 Tax=unclassified Streptomyces TaxID=2593676 RepID=UPI00366574C2
MTHDAAVALVDRLLDGSITDEAEAEAALETLKVELRCPHIYCDFAPELSAEKIMNRVMAYKPFAL